MSGTETLQSLRPGVTPGEIASAARAFGAGRAATTRSTPLCATGQPSSALEPAASGSQQAKPRQPVICRVCERPVDPGKGAVPAELHPACKRFVNFFDAAARALDEIEFAPEGGRRVRGDLIAAANRIPVRWHELRDSRGRFARASGEGAGE